MGNQARAVLEAALALPKDERAALADRIRASIVAEVGEIDAQMYGAYDPERWSSRPWWRRPARRESGKPRVSRDPAGGGGVVLRAWAL